MKEMTKELAQEIVNEWNDIYEDVMRGAVWVKDPSEYEQIFEDDCYIDRYLWRGDAEFCITTDIPENVTYLSETVMVGFGDESAQFNLDELKHIIRENQLV